MHAWVVTASGLCMFDITEIECVLFLSFRIEITQGRPSDGRDNIPKPEDIWRGKTGKGGNTKIITQKGADRYACLPVCISRCRLIFYIFIY